MSTKISILAICGSTRKRSSNLNLIRAIADLASEIFEVTIYQAIDTLPHFNPDMDDEHPPHSVEYFRRQLKVADAILICTPEYAMGVPGTLKNALDWTVSSMEFSKKPVALITASLSGEKAHQALLETLLIIEARITQATQLVISFVRTKVNDEGKITDANTLAKVNQLITSLSDLVTADEPQTLQAPLLMNKV